MIASNEQEAIIAQIIAGNSVCVSAVPGSGKTTTVLKLAKRSPDSILLLTYNSSLKTEVRQKSIHLPIWKFILITPLQ